MNKKTLWIVGIMAVVLVIGASALMTRLNVEGSGVIIDGGDSQPSMVTISFNVTDEIFEAACDDYEYQAFVNDENGNMIDNPITCEEFANKKIKGYFNDLIKQHRINKANRQAKEQVDAMAQPIIIG